MLGFEGEVRERELGRESGLDVVSELSLSWSSSFSSELGGLIEVALLPLSRSADSFLRSFFLWSTTVRSTVLG